MFSRRAFLRFAGAAPALAVPAAQAGATSAEVQDRAAVPVRRTGKVGGSVDVVAGETARLDLAIPKDGIKATVLLHAAPEVTLESAQVFLLAGRVSVVVHGREVAIRSAGQHVGEMGMIDPAAPRCASVYHCPSCPCRRYCRLDEWLRIARLLRQHAVTVRQETLLERLPAS